MAPPVVPDIFSQMLFGEERLSVLPGSNSCFQRRAREPVIVAKGLTPSVLWLAMATARTQTQTHTVLDLFCSALELHTTTVPPVWHWAPLPLLLSHSTSPPCHPATLPLCHPATGLGCYWDGHEATASAMARACFCLVLAPATKKVISSARHRSMGGSNTLA